MKTIKQDFKAQYVGCIVLTKEQKILLQLRGPDWTHVPDAISEFGGRIELNETPSQALVRELQEELGATVKIEDAIALGTILENAGDYNDLVHLYFWHDVEGSITGCYEGVAAYFDDMNAAMQHPKITESVRLALTECKNRHLLK
jgi:8-oxo-dGTP diphosphatase